MFDSLGGSPREDGVHIATREEGHLFRALLQTQDQHLIRGEAVLSNHLQLFLPRLLHVRWAHHSALDRIEEDVGNGFPDAVAPAGNQGSGLIRSQTNEKHHSAYDCTRKDFGHCLSDMNAPAGRHCSAGRQLKARVTALAIITTERLHCIAATAYANFTETHVLSAGCLT